jgi:hypothetical protein
MFPFRRTDKLVQEIEKQGNAYYLLNALIGAYNRRTDVLAKGAGSDVGTKLDEILEAVRGVQLPDVGFISAKLDLILELLEGDTQQKLDASTAQLKSSTDALDTAVKANQPKETE